MSEAPKVTQEMVDDAIQSEFYQMMPSGKTMICELILKNGFSIIGKNSCVSKENFQEDLGKQYSRDNAVQQVWSYLGFMLQQTLHETSQLTSQLSDFKLDDCGDACKI